MHVLIVEDDAALCRFLDRGLKLDGHRVTLVADGESALWRAEQLRPELMILDLGLPLKDGMEVLTEMGDRFRSTSVMVLTGRAEMEVRLRCLDLGADDVILKPFSFHELRARMKALFRRRRRFEDAVLCFGDVEMDRAEHRVMRSGHEVELTATEFSLLESLLRRRGERVCSRMELLREVWRVPQGMGTNIVEVYINYLRRKLGQTRLHGSGLECVIRTVRGQGYVLARSGMASITAVRSDVRRLEQAAG
ncbi:MAG: response regulator transcription factor [Acidobacteriota bacterium]|nr:response regulator transcription factor [Acidobacteriota bacterium]